MPTVPHFSTHHFFGFFITRKRNSAVEEVVKGKGYATTPLRYVVP